MKLSLHPNLVLQELERQFDATAAKIDEMERKLEELNEQIVALNVQIDQAEHSDWLCTRYGCTVCATPTPPEMLS